MKKAMCTALLALAGFAVSLSAQDPVALVIRVQGDVMVSHGGGDLAPVSIGEQMFVGDDLAPMDGSRAILITRTGAQQVVTEQTTMVEPRGAGNPDMFARAMSTLAQAASTDATTGGRQGMIRPIPGQSSLVSPRNSLLVADTRPTFEWTATSDQTYDLMIREVGAADRPVIYEVGSDTTFTLPKGDELGFGASYVWTVFVGGRRGGRPIPEQEFRVMSLEESVDMQDYLDEIAVFGLDPMGDGLFLSVVAYQDMGLLYDAADALDTVESEASLSAEMYLLKGEILAELGQEEAARAAFDRADELMR